MFFLCELELLTHELLILSSGKNLTTLKGPVCCTAYGNEGIETATNSQVKGIAICTRGSIYI
jgi:hypothetical protein